MATPDDEDINETDDDQAHDDEPRPVPVVIPPQPINLLDEVELQVPAAKVPKVSVRPPAVLPVESIHPPLAATKGTSTEAHEEGVADRQGQNREPVHG